MTAGGWAFLVSSLSFVLGLTLWCYVRVLRRDDGGTRADRDDG